MNREPQTCDFGSRRAGIEGDNPLEVIKMNDLLKELEGIFANEVEDEIVKETAEAVSSIKWYCRTEKKYVVKCVSYKCNCTD